MCLQNFEHILSDRTVAYLNVDIAVQGSSVNYSTLNFKHSAFFRYNQLDFYEDPLWLRSVIEIPFII